MLAFREQGWQEGWPLNTQNDGAYMLKFDDISVTLTTDKTYVLQLFAYGQASGYPAECRINVAKRARAALNDAIEEYERREREPNSVVVEFQRHG